MQSGRLDQQLDLLKPVQTNNLGQLETTFVSQGIVWGHVISERGREAIEASRQNAFEIVRVCIRHRSDVDTSWQFMWDDKTFGIERVDRSHRRSRGELWLTARAVGKL